MVVKEERLGLCAWYTRWASAATKTVDKLLGSTFELLCSSVARRTRATIVLSLAVSVVCSLGLFRLSVESDEDSLYLPKHSKSVKDAKWISNTFRGNATEGTRSLSLYCVSASSSANVLESRDGLRALFKLIDAIWNSEPKGGGDALSSQAQLNGFGHPVEASPYVYWNKSRDIFEADDNWRRTLYEQPKSQFGLSEMDKTGRTVATPIPLANLLAKVKYNAPNVTSAKAIQAKFWLRGDVSDNHIRGADRTVARKSHVDGQLLCYLHSHTSYRDAVLGAVQHDLALVVSSISLLMVFATACFAWRDYKDACRAWRLGPVSLISVLLALSSAFGIWMAFGGYFHTLMAAVLFMVLGLGIDDAFVIVDALNLEFEASRSDFLASSQEDTDVVATVIGRACRRAGASILVTTATDAAAFLACAVSSSIPAIQSFCAVAAISVVCDFTFQITFFVACLSLETTVRLKHERRKQLSAVVSNEVDQYDAAKQNSISHRLAMLILSQAGRLTAFAATAALVVVGALGASKLEMEYESQWLAPSGSMVRKAADIEDKYFMNVNDNMVRVYSRHSPRALFDHITEYSDAVESLGTLPWKSGDTKFWLKPGFNDFVSNDHTVWQDPKEFDRKTVSYALAGMSYADRMAFVDHDHNFKCSVSLPFKGDGCNTTAAQSAFCVDLGLCATRIDLVWSKVKDKATQIERLDTAASKLAHAPPELGLFVSRSPTLEALSLTWDSVCRSVTIVTIAAALCCLLLLGRLWAAVLVLFVVAIIDVVLLGALYYIGEYINMITAIILTLGLGLSIDFSAHVTHAFLHSTSLEDPTLDALERMLGPVSKGAGSTLVAVIPMAFSSSYVIRLFCIICGLIISLGYFMGVVFVPAMLFTIDVPCRNRNRQSDPSSSQIQQAPSSMQSIGLVSGTLAWSEDTDDSVQPLTNKKWPFTALSTLIWGVRRDRAPYKLLHSKSAACRSAIAEDTAEESRSQDPAPVRVLELCPTKRS